MIDLIDKLAPDTTVSLLKCLRNLNASGNNEGVKSFLDGLIEYQEMKPEMFEFMILSTIERANNIGDQP